MSGYPPERHVLRDLRLWTERDPDGARSGLPVVPEILDASGDVQLGVLATLVDVAGGELAVRSASPDWVATSELVLHRLRPLRGAMVEARPALVRRSRTSVVLEVTLFDAASEPLALATTSFAIVPARAPQQRMGVGHDAPRTEFARPDSGLDRPLVQRIGVRCLDAAAGRLELPLVPYTVNSLGALQGGVAALLATLAAEAAGVAAPGASCGPAQGAPCVARDLALRYLSLARESPASTSARVLRRDASGALLRVESRDGSGRLATLSSVMVGPPLATLSSVMVGPPL
jgi:acyl-coenzyme A thioesterase PaaI-like protein